MLSFAFMHPQAIRLLLDRAKYDGIVLPPVSQKSSSTVQVYTEALSTPRRQIPVFIYPDLPTMSTVVRSGLFDVNGGKHILCASVSILTSHGFDAIDASSSDAMWRVRANLRSSLNSALGKDAGVGDDVVDKLLAVPELPEQKFSNPVVKIEDRPCVEFSELAALLGVNEQKQQILVALLRYVTWSFVAAQAARLGSTPREITTAALTKLAAANNREFVAYLKRERLKIPIAVVARAKTMFVTSAPASIIAFAARRLGAKRPYSLAIAESGCLSGNAALVESSALSVSDFPIPVSVSSAPSRITSSSMSGLTTTVAAGTYSFTQLLNIIGERVEHAFDVVRRSQSPIVFNRNPTWQGNDNCWEIKTGADFVMMYNGLKYRFCTEESLRPTPANPVTADAPLVVIKSRTSGKKTEPRKPKVVPAAVPAPRAKPARGGAVPAPRAAAPKKATAKLLGAGNAVAVKTLTDAQARKLLPAVVAEKIVVKRAVQKQVQAAMAAKSDKSVVKSAPAKRSRG